MKDRYYSEFISEDFYKKISALRIAKDIKDFEEFVFLFVNSNDCECKFIRENELTTKKINNDEFVNVTNIIVLGFGHWKNYHYENVRYSFIGIFDTEGKESTINLGCIILNSINISSDSYFQVADISSYNITILHNQFQEYLKQVTSPVHKTLYNSLEKCEGKCYEFENKLTLDISFDKGFTRRGPWAFGSILKDLKNFEQKLNSHLGDTDFNPEITFKIKSCELSFDTSS